MISSSDKLLRIMRSGEIISVDKLKEEFKNDSRFTSLATRMSAFMWTLKTERGAIIRSHKQGRSVIGYQLMNYADYTDKELKL